jgi:hypothetical protein
MTKKVSNWIKDIKESLEGQELISDQTTLLQKDRNNFYNELNKKIMIMRKAKELKEHNIQSIDTSTIEDDCIMIISKKIQSLVH